MGRIPGLGCGRFQVKEEVGKGGLGADLRQAPLSVCDNVYVDAVDHKSGGLVCYACLWVSWLCCAACVGGTG